MPYLRYGGMPAVYLNVYPEEELGAYVNTYLKEEILAEGLISLPPFSRFLKTIALANSEMINFTKLANDCQVPPSTVTEYVGLLEDTLVGFLLPAWTESKKRKAIKTGKIFSSTPASHTCWPERKRWTATPIFTGKVLSNLSVWSFELT